MLKLHIKIAIQEAEHLKLLNNLAVELFNAKHAVRLQDNEFNIDDGVNDLRAYYDVNDSNITFICGYKNQVPNFENKIRAYVSENNLKIAL